jgi:hypothetical protein
MNKIQIIELMLELKEQTKEQKDIHRTLLDMLVLLNRLVENFEVKE